MIIGATYGTFDMLHFGHLKLLKKCKENCDYLIVFVSTDKFNKVKGKEAQVDYMTRIRTIAELPFVDEVLPEYGWHQKELDIKEYGIEKIFMGDDWLCKFDYLPCRLIYFPRTPDISSTELRKNDI